MDLLSLLPNEIVLKIFSYLDGDEIFPCLGVSRCWRDFLNYDEFWKKLCHKARIFDSVSSSRGPLCPLCPWAEAYYLYRCIPLKNWRIGKFQHFSLQREESEHFCDAWDGHYVAIYYYTLGKVNVFSIYKEVTLRQVIKVPLPKKEVYNNAMIALNYPYLVVARFNVAIIYKYGTSIYNVIKNISIGKTFEFGFNLSNRNAKVGAEIAWGCLWMKAEPVKDTFVVCLSNFSHKFLIGKPHLAFNDNVKLVLAWSKSSVKVASLTGDVLLSLEKNKVRAVDFNSNVIVVKVENDIEIIDIKNGTLLSTIKTSEKIEFGLGNNLIVMEGNKISTLTSYSLQNSFKEWSIEGLKGRACDLRLIGSKYMFVVPSYSRDHYCLVNFKGKFIREDPLPQNFDQFPSPVFSETLPFMVITNEETFDILTFM